MNSDYLIQKDVNDKHVELTFKKPMKNEVLEQYIANQNKNSTVFSNFTSRSLVNGFSGNKNTNRPPMSSFIGRKKMAFSSIVE